MKHILLKLLLIANSILLILYLGLFMDSKAPSGIRETIPLLLSSLILIDSTYISVCNLRENKVISLFCGLLALDGWYILLSVSDDALTHVFFLVLSPVIWCVSIRFMLLFLFQDSGYRFRKAVNFCLIGTCIFSLTGILISERVFALLYAIQLLLSWLCFLFLVIYHWKRAAFVLRAEGGRILFSFVTILLLSLIYVIFTRGIKGHLANFGIYLPVLLFSMGIHSIILKEHNNPPLSAVFSKRQLILLLLFGAAICALLPMTLGTGWQLFFLLLDSMFLFVYTCNITLDFNLKQGKSAPSKESGYYAALAQLQREEALKLEFANFLHDEILQDLLSIGNLMHKADCPAIRDMMTETLHHMNCYIREQMQDYHPILLPKLTIKENYQNLLAYLPQSFPQRSIRLTFDCPDTLFLAAPYDIFVYRLLRELVTNIYKHSTGDKAWITLTQNDGIITLQIEDNGSADTASLLSADLSNHRGLSLLTKQVNTMNGTVSITNRFPHGICIQVTLPMKGDVSYQYFIS
ncbi:MAG: ATP-binding protein [Muribaculaceae bacterium]|nr:ATP-binding protein [Muribaculaceae bacterium]